MPSSKSALARTIAALLVVSPALLLMGARPVEPGDVSKVPRLRIAGVENPIFQSPVSGPPQASLAPDQLAIVTAHWTSRAQLRRIAARFQHVQVDEQRRTARVEASADDLLALRRMGVRVELDTAATQRMQRADSALRNAPSGRRLMTGNAIPQYACYRTVEETYLTMDSLAVQQPTLASVVDIGPTWTWQKTNGAQGHRMRVLRISNAATDAALPDKPNIVVLAAIHAREYTTAELTTRFAEWLVKDYNVDADATWLVDNFRFHFILQANPDGRKKAESGLSWRKNTDTDNGTCSANSYGVDLNRNFSWQFGQVPDGSSPDPCDATYRGPSAVSETETANLMKYIVGTRGGTGTFAGGVLPDLRTDTGTAPTNYRGLFLDIHSFSQLVLWPWASTSAAAPNGNALRTLGRRLAYFNNYAPRQWIGLYPADGTNTDTVYGLTGAPSYTIELGQEFFEDCPTFEDSTYPMNLAALKYAARTAFAPYTLPAGPDTTEIAGSARSILRGKSFAVSAWVDDARANQSNGTEPVQNIASVRAYLDAPPWSTNPVSFAMQANDGAFNTSRELATVTISTRNLRAGRHVVYVAGTDAAGNPGTPRAVIFNVIEKAAPQPSYPKQ
jgi:murein tripeptide amidase MpaA